MQASCGQGRGARPEGWRPDRPSEGETTALHTTEHRGAKRHLRGTDKEHGHKAAIKAVARPRLEPPKTKKPYQRPLALRINSALPS